MSDKRPSVRTTPPRGPVRSRCACDPDAELWVSLPRGAARAFAGTIIWVALLMPTLSFGQSSVHDFELGGSASLLGEDCIRLTPDKQYASGSAWFKQPIDLRRPFEMEVSLVLGEKDLAGADGIVFVFHPKKTTGWRGEGMGFAGLAPSLGIEFDTYRNLHLSDPVADHLALMADGQTFHGPGSLGLVELKNLEDGARHPLRIVWDPKAGKLLIFLDDKLKGTFPGAILKSIFGEQTEVYWGMTAATGRLSNYQDVCIERLFLGV